ncbi:hypothetical protein ACFE04_012987 [Oxalis oulophora]
MKRCSPTHFNLRAATATADVATAMSSRPSSYRGGRGRGQRNFSGKPNNGGSHIDTVRDANLGFRRGSAGYTNQPPPPPLQQEYRQVPPPPFYQNQHYRQVPPPFQQQYRQAAPPAHDQNQQYRQAPRQPYDRNQQYRQGPPPVFNQNQQYRQGPPPAFYQNQQYCQGPPPAFYQNQQFRPPNNVLHQRPPSFGQNQVVRPQYSKPKDYRNWESAKTALPPNAERFTVLSYNILAEYLAIDHRGKLYFHIPRNMLDWQWRKQSILFELKLWSADIMCFQEVDKFEDLEQELKHRGYSGLWKMRTGVPLDGCAIFWRTSRFKLLYEESIEFNKLGLRDNVAQICVLELLDQHYTELAAPPSSSESTNKVVMCNIHVLYNPKRGEIKLGQVRNLLDRAYSVSKTWNDAPVVLCGDFNCIPKSPLYNFILEQKLDLSGIGRDNISGQASAQIHTPKLYNPNPRLVSDPSSVTGKESNSKSDSLSGNQRRNKSDVNVDKPDKHIQRGIEDSAQSNEVASGTHSISSENSVECSTTLACEGRLLIGDKGHPRQSISRAENEKISTGQEDNVSLASPNIYLDEKMDKLSLDEGNKTTIDEENIVEDDIPFVSALHDNEDLDGFSPARQSNYDKFQSTYNPSLWTPMEIATATGNVDCTILEHSLKLKSTYTEVEDCSGTRDSCGEPLVTSYNRCFMGTVDYIWRSEGLQTTKVLAPIPKHAMEWTPGFPTKKWGSDHIALASELVFTKDLSNQNTEAR